MIFLTTKANYWLSINLQRNDKTEEGFTWPFVFAISYWMLWMQRNQLVFQGKCVLRKHELVKAMVFEVQKINYIDLSNLNSSLKEEDRLA